MISRGGWPLETLDGFGLMLFFALIKLTSGMDNKTLFQQMEEDLGIYTLDKQEIVLHQLKGHIPKFEHFLSLVKLSPSTHMALLQGQMKKMQYAEGINV